MIDMKDRGSWKHVLSLSPSPSLPDSLFKNYSCWFNYCRLAKEIVAHKFKHVEIQIPWIKWECWVKGESDEWHGMEWNMMRCFNASINYLKMFPYQFSNGWRIQLKFCSWIWDWNRCFGLKKKISFGETNLSFIFFIFNFMFCRCSCFSFVISS